MWPNENVVSFVHYWRVSLLVESDVTAAPDNSAGDNYIGLFQHHSLNISTHPKVNILAGDNTNHQIKCFWPPGKWLELAHISQTALKNPQEQHCYHQTKKYIYLLKVTGDIFYTFETVKCYSYLWTIVNIK